MKDASVYCRTGIAVFAATIAPLASVAQSAVATVAAPRALDLTRFNSIATLSGVNFNSVSKSVTLAPSGKVFGSPLT